MDQSWGGQGGSKTPNTKIQSFLEALRASQGSRGDSKSEGGPKSFSEFQNKKEIEKKRIEQFQQARQQEWNQIFSAKERAVERRIEEVREQIKQLRNSLQRLDNNLDNSVLRAVNAPTKNSGTHQISYLEHIMQEIMIFRLKVNETNSFLEVFNGRSKKQGMYWGMAAKKGNSYTQSNERNVATSIG